MEKYSQFRDRGTGISPFLPSTTPASSIPSSLLHVALFLVRLPLFVSYSVFYFVVLDHLPVPQFVRKLLLWSLLGIPGIWWVDLQLDGVKRGSLSQQPASRFPGPRSVIAAQFTSPVDALYLAAIFDPVFVVSYPGTRKVLRVSLLRAILLALAPPALAPPPPPAKLTTLRALLEQNPHRIIAAFPEMTTTNGKGILPLSPSILGASTGTRIFAISIRYTPPDITTPVPGAYRSFLWTLLSRPTHLIRVRIAEGLTISTNSDNVFAPSAADQLANGDNEGDAEGEAQAHVTPEEQAFLDRLADAFSRLARNKRVGLTLHDKVAFVEAWGKAKK
ncbi:hypothetical protein GGS23DRAFT_424829 [Durotheca rogersii]|uniref:uncharacterized protein n=1 Tax=Durotheca rogersii TaxID=419775 RepID=UPI00221EB7EF|nr:uncharacterized protein GGS23DRAFT_424829 [Durotheca rogersii]KAI5865388.1 hypothetical protein GGS23DRAFT_424829 [Durotheca rogersii]